MSGLGGGHANLDPMKILISKSKNKRAMERLLL